MRKKLTPFIFSALIVILDQVTKALVVAYIPENTVKFSLFNDFLRIVHVRNTAVAFSLGEGLEMPLKIVLFIVVPLILVAAISYYIVKDEREFSRFEEYMLAGFVGGGCGNLIDRVFRHMSVVDFISTNNYGLFGMERFPTYNIADASVVICVILLVLSMLFFKKGNKNEQKS